MEESLARRGEPGPEPHRDAGFYETALRVIGRYMDEQKPRDVFFFEQDGAFVVRLFHGRPGRAATTSSPSSPATTSPSSSPAGPTLRVPIRRRPTRPPRRPDAHPDQRIHRPSNPHRTEEPTMKALKTVAVALGITLAALIVIPLVVLAGLFVWLKVTEEQEDDLLELDREGA